MNILSTFGIKLLSLFLILNFHSCNKKVEIWKSTYLMIQSKNKIYEEHFIKKSQYLHLFPDGQALIIDSS